MSENSPPRVLVSVLSFDNVEDTLETWRSLKSQTYPNYRVEIVDNGSKAECTERLKRELDPDTGIVFHPENLGFARGMNSILERGKAEGYTHVVLCNNDVSVPNRAVQDLVETAGRYPDAGLVGGVEIDYYDGGIRCVGGKGFSLWTGRIHWDKTSNRGDAPIKFKFVQGSAILFAEAALKAGISFDENLFIYCEEPALGFDLAKKGLTAYTDPRVEIRHKAAKRYLNPLSGYYMQRNRIYLVRKYGRGFHVAFCIAYLLLAELPAKVILRSLRGHWDYAHACLRGFADGLSGRMGKAPQ